MSGAVLQVSITFELDNEYHSFEAHVTVDDTHKPSDDEAAVFELRSNGAVLWVSKRIQSQEDTQHTGVISICGITELTLVVSSGSVAHSKRGVSAVRSQLCGVECIERHF